MKKAFKTCPACGQEFPATLEYFYKKRDGLNAKCKPCANLYSRVLQRRFRELYGKNRVFPEKDPGPVKRYSPIQREVYGDTTVVTFNQGWKPNSSPRSQTGMVGYSSALTKIY